MQRPVFPIYRAAGFAVLAVALATVLTPPLFAGIDAKPLAPPPGATLSFLHISGGPVGVLFLFMTLGLMITSKKRRASIPRLFRRFMPWKDGGPDRANHESPLDRTSATSDASSPGTLTAPELTEIELLQAPEIPDLPAATIGYGAGANQAPRRPPKINKRG